MKSNKHLHLLQAIYHEPPSSNIHWREIESLFSHLGATVESAHGARFHVMLNRVEGIFTPASQIIRPVRSRRSSRSANFWRVPA